MKLSAIIILATVALAAQTAITPEQTRATKGTGWRIVAYSPEGVATLLEIGPGLEVAGGKIISSVPSMGFFRQFEILTPAGDGSYTAPEWMGTVTRNGLSMTLGVDCDITGGRIVPRYPWPSGDIIVARGWVVAKAPPQPKP